MQDGFSASIIMALEEDVGSSLSQLAQTRPLKGLCSRSIAQNPEPSRR
jgi:hypothetical protein